MRRRKRRRTMRTESGDASSSRADADTSVLCVHGVCSVRPDAVSDAPRSFNASDKGKHLQVSENGLTVEYDGPDDTEKNACSVRTHSSVPVSGVALFYFEISVDDAGKRGNIGVGLCGGSVKLEKMPGWEHGSFGYHGDDGLIFRQSGEAGNKYGPKYGAGDTVGCCWDLVDDVVFFTKNGVFLGRAFEGLSGPLFPTIGMQTKGGRITANFGAAPFAYDIEGYARQQRERVLAEVNTRPLPADGRLLANAVLGYLIHSGYAETAASFAADAGRVDVLDAERASMLERQAVCAKIVAGDIDGAIADLRVKFPCVLETPDRNVLFLLRTQKFIEMIVSGASPEDAVEYGQKELAPFREPPLVGRVPSGSPSDGSSPSGKANPYSKALQDVYSLLVYVNPAECPNKHLTKQSRRDMVAAMLNAAILRSQGRATKSVLERLVCHSELVLRKSLKQANGPFALLGVKDFM